MRARLSVLMLLALAMIPVAAIACSHELAIDDWLAKADAICRQAQAAADANPAPQSPLPGDVLRLTASRSKDELEQLRKLDPPSQNTDAVAEYLLTLGHRNDELGNYADELDKTPTQGPLPSRAHLEELTTEAYTLGVALGLNDCNGGVDFTIDTTTSSTAPADDGGTTPPPTGVGGQPNGEDNTQDTPGAP